MNKEKIKRVLKHLHYDIAIGIKNCIIWFPVIWNDRPWDHYFLYKILHKKLYRMEKFFRKGGVSKSSEKEAKKMKLCVLLLKRLLENHYEENAEIFFRKKWGEAQLKCTPTSDKKYVEIDFVYETVHNDKEKEQNRKEFLRYMQHADDMRKQDIDLLFQTIAKNIQGWWD